MSFLQVPDHVIPSKPKSKEGFRRVYTSQNDDIPTQLSYQSIKLANFIELQLTDLWDSLQQITEQNFKNQLKQSLSRSYNAFHEMQKLYSDLGMNFLYSQTKKLISSYGIIFVHMMQTIQKYEKKSEQQKNIQKQIVKQATNPFQKQVKQAIDKIIHNKEVKEIKNYKRLRGIHLFNQSYARCIDYDVQSFKQLRQRLRESQKTQQQKEKSKIQQQRKFKKQVLQQLNDFNHMKVDGQELYLFLSRQKKINQISTKFSLQDQLQKIAAYFKQSQHQALQFLRKEKNLQSFHELTEGFNLIVSDYENNKAVQFSYVQEKIKEIFQYINKKIRFYEAVIDQKDKQIQNLKQINSNKKLFTVDNQSQTYHNFDEEIKQLAKRVVTTEMINSQLKSLLQKTSEQDRKQKNSLLQQISMKESSCRQFRDVIQQKINYIVKIQRKVKILNENNKNKNIKDPIQFFNGLSDQMKRNFFQELKQQGFINRTQDKRISYNKNPKIGKTNDSLLDRKEVSIMESKATQSPTRQLKKRQSSLFKRSSSKEWNSKTSTIDRKSRNIGHNEDQDYVNSQLRTYKDNVQEKEIFRSKKFIRHAPNQANGQKPRVFDIKDNSGFEYSHKIIEGDETYQKRYNLSNQSSNYGKSSLQSSLKNILAQNYEQNTQGNDQNYQKNQKSIIKNISKQQSMNRSIKIIQNCEKIKFQQIGQTQLEGSTLNNNQQNKTIQQKEVLDNQDKIVKNNASPQRQDTQIIIDNPIRRSKSKSKSRKMIRYEDQQNLISNAIKIINYQKQNETESFKIQIKKKNSTQSQYNGIEPDKNYIIKPEELKSEKNNRIQTCNSAKSINRIRQKNKMRMKVSNEYNITITNTPIMSSKIIKELTNLEKIKQEKKDKIKKTNKIEENPTKRQMRDVEKNQNNQKDEEIKNYMRNTAKRINKTQTFQQIGGDYENRQTKTIIKNKENIKHNSHQSLTNTFHKNTNERKHQRNVHSQILTNQKTKQSEEQNKRESFQQDTSKNNAAFLRSTESEAIKKLIEEQFGQEDVILASRASATVQQFKDKVIKFHVKRCGQKCQHLQRFLQIFKKLRRESNSKRQLIKIHIENMNEKLGESFSNGFNLPFIKK